MTRLMPAWSKWLVSLTVAVLVGVCIGLVVAPHPEPPLLQCRVEPLLISSTPPCPPSDSRVVWAVWEGVRVPAHWDGRAWVLSQPVLGVRRTTQPPQAWSEL